MNEKFEKLLTLAMRGDTGEQEAVAAFLAMRRMGSSHSLETLLGEAPTPKERIVYRDASRGDYSLTMTISIPGKWAVGFLESFFKRAHNDNIGIEVISLDHQNDYITSGIRFKVKLTGTQARVESLNEAIDAYIERIKPVHEQSFKYTPPEPPPQEKKKGFFSSLFGD